MATEKTPAEFRGLMLSDERATLWDAESTFTQATPQAGVPEPQQSTRATLRTSGSMAADKAYRLRTLRGGFAGGGASWVWRNEADLVTEFRGWNQPSVLQGFEAVRWTDGSGAHKYTKQPNAITTTTGEVLCAYYTRDTDRAIEYGIEVSIRSTAGTWSTVLISTTANDVPTLQKQSPALMLMPSGRVLCYYWVYDTSTNQANIRSYYSDDSGASWALGEPAVLDEAITYSTTEGAGTAGYLCGRIRAAYSGGTICLVVQVRRASTSANARDTFQQWASADLGSRFTQVEEWGDTAGLGGNWQDVLPVQGGFLFVYIDLSDKDPISKRIGNAYSKLTAAASQSVMTTVGAMAEIDAGNKYFVDGDCSACVDETGYIYVYPRATAVVGMEAIAISMSTTGGRSWETYGQGSLASGWSPVYNVSDTGTHPRDYSVTAQGGRIAMMTNWDATPANEDDSLGAIYFGGWSTVTMPTYTNRYGSEMTRVGFEHTWLPFDLPNNVGWTAVGAGTATLNNGYLEIATSGNAKRYNIAPTGTATEGMIVLASFEVDLDGTIATDRAGMRVRCESAGVGYIVDVQCSTAAMVIRDEVAGSNLATLTSGIDLTAGIDLLVAVGDAKCSVWWRQRDNSEDRKWVELVKGVAVSDNSGATGTHLVEFGNRQVGTANTKWYNVCWVSDEWAGQGLHDMPTNPDDLLGRDYSAAPSWLDSGAYVSASNGSTVRGDEWKVATRYDHEIERALIAGRQPSPRVGWRSTSTAQQQIAFQLTSLADTEIGNGILGIALFGTNVGQVVVEGYDLDTTAWVSLGTASATDGLAPLDYVRQGDTVRPSGVTPADPPEPFINTNELVDGYFFFGSGTGRTIRANSQGKWTHNSTKHCVLELDSVAGGDATAGSAGSIVPRSWAILLDLKGARYSGIRITIPTPTGTIPVPPQAYWEIGTLLVGSVVLHGDQYSWGRTIELQAGTEVLEARDRTTRSRVDAPTRRVVSYAWSDAIDQTQATNAAGNADPDFAQASDDASAEAVTVMGSTAMQMQGIAKRINGADVPVVYLPRVARFANGAPLAVLNRDAELILGRVVTPVAIEGVQGDELVDEVVRVATLTIQEEV